MFCLKCGAENPDGSMYCLKCGYPIGKPTPEALEIKTDKPKRKSNGSIIA